MFEQHARRRELHVRSRREVNRHHLVAAAGERVGQYLQRDVAIELVSRARYTSPMPPAPSGATISDGPILDPEGSDISYFTGTRCLSSSNQFTTTCI
jgi:hypothetical protein